MAKEGDSLVIDAHCHVGTSEQGCWFTDRRYTVDELVKVMDKCGVNLACVSGGGLPHEVDVMNEMALKAVKDYPGRVLGFYRVDPYRSDLVEDMERYLDQHGFKGLKIHTSQDHVIIGYGLLKEVDAACAAAEKYGVPVEAHTGNAPGAIPWQLLDVAERFPKVTFIMVHSGMDFMYQSVVPTARRAGNIVLDTSADGFAALEGVRALGKDRAVFGSNWPTSSMRAALLFVTEAGLSEEQRADVLGGTMARILGVENPKS